MQEILTAGNENGKITLRVNENITSTNSEQLKEAAENAVRGQTYARMEIDLGPVEYISSAGLRVILSLYRKETAAGRGGESFVITGASATVYETMEITGFTDMMDVRRAMRRVSLENATIIGTGFNSNVYRLDDENIVKVFIHDDSSEEDIQRELGLAKYALIRGIPTAISYDLVEADGKKGVIFEMMNCGSLRDYIRDDPGHISEHVDKYVGLLHELHSTRDAENRLPDARDRMIRHLDDMRGWFAPEDFDRLMKIACTLPKSDTILHGDCHIKNIMLHNGEPVLIDLDTLSHGDPVIELGNMYYAYIAFEELWPGNNEKFFGIPQTTIERMFRLVLDRYFAGADDEKRAVNMDRVCFAGAVRMLHFLKGNKPDEQEAIDRTKEQLIGLSSRLDSLGLDLT